MAIRNIVREGDPVLNKKCRVVEVFNDRLAQLIDDMAQTMHHAEGVGLAAPQVGVLKRVVVVDIGNGVIELVNPRIIMKAGEQVTAEGCLSCPNEYGLTKRPMYVTVAAQDRNGKEFTVNGEGLLAKAFCHEIDHLDGILYKQIAIRMLREDELE